MSKFKLVPVEPTPEMLEAGRATECTASEDDCAEDYRAVYRAMWEAAPEQPVQEPVAWRYQNSRGNYRYRGYKADFDKDYPLLKPVKLYTAPPDTDALLRQALEALDAELSPDWECNSYHPKLHAVHAVLRKHLGAA